MSLGSQYICKDCLQTLRATRQLNKITRSTRHASTSSNTTRLHSPLRLGIIGSGPAGFYAAARVLQKLPKAHVDMYEKLPVPFGLVRYGVAPDHPEVKNCQDRFEEVASSDRFQFIGNVTIGHDLRLADMKQHYDAFLFAYGAAKDRLLGIPGERELRGIHAAREFVGWYNGLPEFANLQLNLDTDHAVVIGNGNVALDVARILLSSVDTLRKTDISEAALDALSQSRINRVTIAGRRGPMQAAFTIKEVRELVDLPSTAFYADNKELIPSADWIAKLPRLEQRKYRFAKLLTTQPKLAPKQCHLRSLISPTAFLSGLDSQTLSHIEFHHNAFKDDLKRFDPSAQVRGTQRSEQVEAGIAFRSIGYQSVTLPGLEEDLNVDFLSSKGIIAHDGYGRAWRRDRRNETGTPVTSRIRPQDVAPGCYCTGWVKNGPTGVIATTMEDAFATADSIISDLTNGEELLNGVPTDSNTTPLDGWDGLRGQVGAEKAVSWRDWQKIDKLEKRLGKAQADKPRTKLVSIGELVKAAKMPE